jgi:phosphatidylinositol-3-phosphatase
MRKSFGKIFITISTKYFLLCSLLAAILHCTGAVAAVPVSNHVYVLMEENHSYESVIGNSAMPYFNLLAQQYGLATEYYANSHYSIPNYMWLTAGAYVTMNDNTKATFNVDNIVPHLQVAGKSWKEYAESLPYEGYTGYNVGNYVERHDPFPYFTDVADSSEKNNIVPFTELSTDIANHDLPNYAFITPNLLDDAHNGTLAAADKWLKTNIAPLIASPEFQQDGILIITWDESFDSDCRPVPSCPPLPENKGGGRIATLVIGPRVKSGYKSTTFYQHPSVLKTMSEALGLTTFPGAAQSAPDMGEFFDSGTSGKLNVSMAISPAQVTVAPGGTATYQVEVTPRSHAAGNVCFACANLPSGASCSFKPAVLDPGSSAAATTLTVSTAPVTAHLQHGWETLVSLVPGFSCFGLLLTGHQRRAKPHSWTVLGVLTVLGVGILLQACGNGGGSGSSSASASGTTAGKYTITVTAASASSQTSATTGLVVQ